MALLMFQGFDFGPNNSNGSDLNTYGALLGWVGNACTKTAGQLGGSAINNQGSNANYVQWQHTAALTTVVFGGRFCTTGVGAGGMFSFLDSAGATQVGVAMNASKQLFLFRGTTANVIATGSTVFVAGGYYYIELKVTIGASAAYELRINGTTEFSGTGNTQQTGNANVQYFKWSNQTSSSISMTLDDVYILDTTGSAPHNDFLGKIRVETLFCTSNNSVTFTPLASTNVSQINETETDNDTSYNYTSSANTDTFNHGALSSTPQTIFALAVWMKARIDDASTVNARTKLLCGVSHGTTQNGASNELVSIYQYFRDTYLTDPSSSSAWDASGVNNSQIGYERL